MIDEKLKIIIIIIIIIVRKIIIIIIVWVTVSSYLGFY